MVIDVVDVDVVVVEFDVVVIMVAAAAGGSVSSLIFASLFLSDLLQLSFNISLPLVALVSLVRGQTPAKDITGFATRTTSTPSEVDN